MDQGQAIKSKAIIRVYGVVQGVGFRPFVARLANEHGVTGFVKNECGNVLIEAVASASVLSGFLNDISERRPAASHISLIEKDILTINSEDYPESFRIISSDSYCGGIVMPSPDIAMCDDCLRELFTPDNPRYQNPFISCTNCGPRFSILHAIPYDRANTTMQIYPMCTFCEDEYADPSNRRFHAQTVCCNDCGPIMEYVDREKQYRGPKAMEHAIQALQDGKIVAVKGVGGYHLACSPFDDFALFSLRALKGRDQKPFAVMFQTIEEIQEHCAITPEEEALLTSPARPIVLLRRIKNALSYQVCTTSPYLGAFLPYTPLQHILLEQTGPLVMTSANVSSLPIIKADWEIGRFFKEHPALPGVLLHDRDILRRLDDSVVMVVHGKTHFIRRARGYVPLPIAAPVKGAELMACGSQEKCTICLQKDGLLYPSSEIGDLDSMEAHRAYRAAATDMRNTLRISPSLAVCDMHPGYESTRYAKTSGLPVLEVQHHYAHIASVMAEHCLDRSIIGVAFDGTGYGTDGTVWGGEFLIASAREFKRVAHLKPVKLLGSDESIRQGWKSAICILHDAGIQSDDNRASLIVAALQNGINTIRSSSMGRVFDAVSSILGICEEAHYSGQCAIELEYAAMRYRMSGGQSEPLPYNLTEENEALVVDLAPCIRELYKLHENGSEPQALAARFHATVSRMIADVCTKLRNLYGINEVALSGGVFFNRILLEEAIPLLQREGFAVYTNNSVPAGDGGLSLGQAYIGLMAENH